MLCGLLAGCGVVDERLPVAITDGGATVLTAGCAGDESCPAGMVCEGCNGPQDAFCVPGCRADAQCPKGNICNPGVTCLTCPCAPGWCELDPCRDVDGDGYAWTLFPGAVCPGKQVGDCNDGNKDVHPGQRELCANFIDDDCDERTDRRDESCQACTADSLVCNDASTCAPGGQVGVVKCEQGCCLSCPAVVQPSCRAGERSVGGGLDPTTACRVARQCVTSSCDREGFFTVCGRDYATYRNACEARLAGVEVLHRGSCQWDEGVPCDGLPAGVRCVSSNAYCREDPVAGKRCTQVGTCRVDDDCPAGLEGRLSCEADAGVERWRCEQSQCVARCAR